MKTKIVNRCCELFDVHPRDLLGDARFNFLTTPRFAMYKALSMRGWSNARIGRFMGRDPKTVGYGLIRATDIMSRSPEYTDKINAIAQMVDDTYGWVPSPDDVFTFVCTVAGEQPIIVRRTSDFLPFSRALVSLTAKVCLDAGMPVSKVAGTLGRAAATVRTLASRFNPSNEMIVDLYPRTVAEFPKKVLQ